MGQEIRSLRKVGGMSLQELGRLAGKSVGHLSQIERGLSHPSISALQAISHALGVQIRGVYEVCHERIRLPVGS